MSDHDSPQEIHKAVRRYLYVFGFLIFGTIMTVVASRFPIQSVAITIIIALAIACAKGFLVVGYFMHLLSEKKMIYGILIATVFFFAGLMYLTVWSMNKESLIHMQEPATTQHVP